MRNLGELEIARAVTGWNGQSKQTAPPIAQVSKLEAATSPRQVGRYWYKLPVARPRKLPCIPRIDYFVPQASAVARSARLNSTDDVLELSNSSACYLDNHPSSPRNASPKVTNLLPPPRRQIIHDTYRR